jgi:hypothetical protein
VRVVAIRSNGSWLASGYSSPLLLNVGAPDTVYVSVQPNNALGPYTLEYYNASSLPPQAAPAGVESWLPNYTIRWNAVPGATGYRVSRSTSQAGTYEDIGSEVTHDGSYTYTFTDSVSSGTYWYKVRAVNGSGDGPDSAPVTFAPIPLTQNDWAEGTLTVTGQVDWYRFTAAQGTTYYIQWDDVENGSAAHTGDLMVSAYLADGTVIFEMVDSGYSSPRSFTGTGGTVYVRVSPYNEMSPKYLGTYAIRYYE